jgi:hypothetical protein
VLAAFNPWVPLFALVAVLQIPQHSPKDLTIFSVGVVLLLASNTTEQYTWHTRPISTAPVLWILGLCAPVLALAERHGTIEAVGVFLLLPLALWQVSASSKKPFDTAQQPVRRTPVVIWTIPILILLALEFLAILLTTVHNRYDYPTISSLIDPLFNTRVGHIICVTLWLTAGAALLIPRRSPATSEVPA